MNRVGGALGCMLGLMTAVLGLTAWAFESMTRPVGVSEMTAAASNRRALPEPYIVEVRGSNLRWRFQHPGPDGVPATADDRIVDDRLLLPAEHAVRLRFQSDDYLYTWSLPVTGAEQIAVPGLTFEVALPPLASGCWNYHGNPFCGGDHTRLSGVLTVVPVSDFLP
ncbi:MAG: hypothetical protein SFV23_15380 [Planctomycetaceae bacterium]|nr:hypothetical protein [Planctomycetaceae bacterium]